jgi:carboxypeptidase Q
VILTRPIGRALLIILVIPWILTAQQREEVSAEDGQILSEISQHNELMKNLEYLSDLIGPRLTGSTQQRMASEWAEREFRTYGLTNVHQETWTIAHSWTRGTADAQLIAPISRRLAVVSTGWSPSTDGEVEGPVVYVDAKSVPDLDRYRTKLTDAIVILGEPRVVVPPYQNGHPAVQFPLRPPYTDSAKQTPEPDPFYAMRTKFFKAEGVRAVLRDSGNPYNLMRMSNGSAGDYAPGVIPSAYLSHEDYALVWRLLKRGDVRLRLNLNNSFSSGPAETSNTVAELRGGEKPDEIVILGAHIDSWDLASGSTDNGTGVVSILEAARALVKLNLAPRRTIRFVLFSGEEQGEVGSRVYVSQHKQELSNISAILVNDTGTGPIVTIGVHENYDDIEALHRILAPMASQLQLLEPKLSRTFGSDYASFNAAGVPGFSCIGDTPEYSETEHTQSDTFDKASEAGLVQSAELMAVWAFNTAQYPTLLPRNAKGE